MRTLRGFTLIELLVVIVIASIMVGLAVFSISNKPQQAQIKQEALRLQSLTQLLADTAVSQNKEWGLLLTETGYQFYQLDNQKHKWTSVEDLPAEQKNRVQQFVAHTLPDAMWVHLTTEDHVLTLLSDNHNNPDSNATGENNQADVIPNIVFLSSGEYTPFVIDMGVQGQTETLVSIYGDGIAPLKLLKADDREKLLNP